MRKCLWLLLQADKTKPQAQALFRTAANCPQLWRAVQALPSRTTTGML